MDENDYNVFGKDSGQLILINLLPSESGNWSFKNGQRMKDLGTTAN